MSVRSTDLREIRWFAALCGALLVSIYPSVVEAETLDELSNPPGYVLQTTYPFNGSVVTTVVATLSEDPHRFTHWTINSNRMDDNLSRAQNPAVFTITNDTEAVAWYEDVSVDGDQDEVGDWYEVHYLGSTNSAAGSDGDADGFDLHSEYVRGYHPGIMDGIQDGGISRRMSSSALLVLDSAWYRYREYSDPAGYANLEQVISNGVSVTTTNFSGIGGGYVFAYWDVAGIWQGEQGRALSEVSVTVTSDVDAVAHFYAESEDLDTDNVADWYEWHFYGGLASAAGSDTDSDGYDLSDEYTRAYHPQHIDSNKVGGISRRRSATTAVYGPPNVGYVIDSIPAGFMYEYGFVTSGSEIVTSTASGEDGGYMFSYWTVNGERQEDGGRASDGLSVVLTGDTTITAHYFDKDEDVDTDGVADWYEWHFYGHLVNDSGHDPDLDGFDLLEEYTRNQHPGLADTIQAGGVSRRWSHPIVLDYQTLLVESPYGNASPAAGTNLFPYGTLLDCSVLDSPVVMGDTQYVCYGWTGTDDVLASGSTTNTSVALSNDSTIAWLWLTNHWLDVTEGPSGSVDQVDQWCMQNSNVVVTATPDTGYHFGDWGGDTNGCAIAGTQITVPMDRARAVAASFALNLYDITASAGANGSISPNGTVWVGHGSNETFTITSNPKYHILDVEIDGGSIGVTNSYTFLNVTNARTIDATLEINSNSLTATSDYGTPAPSGTVWHDEGAMAAASITGSPLVMGGTQYVCVGWAGAGDAGSGSTTNTSFVISNDSTVVWQWLTNYWLETESMSSGSVDVVDGWYMAGSNIVVTAYPESNYQLYSWSGDTNGCAVGINQITVPIDQARHVWAVFSHTSPVDGLVLHYSFDKNSATAVIDDTGRWPTGSVHGAQWIADAPGGGAYWFDGTNDYIRTPNEVTFPANADDFTFAAWVKAEQLSGDYRTIVCNQALEDFQCQIQNDKLVMWTGLPSTAGNFSSPHTWRLDVWYHVVVVRSNLTIKMYRNAEQIYVGVDASSVAIGGSALDIGFRAGTGQYPWHGAIDEVRVYDRALASNEVHTLYSTEFGNVKRLSVSGSPSPYGASSPYDYGDSWMMSGAMVTNIVASPVAVGDIRHVCNGWSGTGSVPASGAGTQVVFAIATNSTLMWHWYPEFYLDVSAETGGVSDVTGSWHSNGTVVVLTAAPSPGYEFTSWSGDVPGGSTTNNPLTLTMDSARNVSAGFTGVLYHYVSPAGGDIFPYTTWATAARVIQDAVDAATDGDTVLLTNGVYSAGGTLHGGATNLVVVTNAIVLRGVHGPRVTAIDGSDLVRGMYLSCPGAVVEDVTIRNCRTSIPGAGCYINRNGTLRRCVISNNRTDVSYAHGAGVLCYQGGLVEDCEIVSNDVQVINARGGGISLDQGGVVRNCVIRDNSAFSRGGGAFCDWGGLVQDCMIVSNAAASGGGVDLLFGGTVERCAIVSNSALASGGGLLILGDCTVRNCLLSYNNSKYEGGGASVHNGGFLENCTIVSNSASNRGGGANFFNGGTGVNCIVVHNAAPSERNLSMSSTGAGIPPVFISSCTTPAAAGSGNIVGDPAFVDAKSGNFRLLAGSVCIDAGDNSATTMAIDFDGLPRELDGDTSGSCIVDMGCFEFAYGDSDIDGMPDAWECGFGMDPKSALGADGPIADNDGDGRSNLQEYLDGSNPFVGERAILASAAANGVVVPSGIVWVVYGSNQAFVAVPNAGYDVAGVSIDGGSIGPINSYTFINVTNMHSIAVVFEISSNSLVVTSEYGVPSPAGTSRYSEGTVIDAFVAGSFVEIGGTQQVCVGWAGTGDAGSGVATNTTFVISNNSTIAWQWITNYWLDVEASGSGSVDIVDGWCLSGTQRVISATADTNYSFSVWTGDVPVGAGTNNPLIVTMDMARAITAHFVTNPGTITIDVEPSQGSWFITTYPASYIGPTNGVGDLVPTLAPIGDYTVAYGELQLYRSPASQTLTVAPDEAKLFTGYYTGTGRRPKLEWTATPGATWYRLYIKRNGSLYENRWVNQTNSWWIPDVDYPGGNYTWWVQAYVPGVGKGAWVAGTPFTIGVRTPGKVTQSAPSGVADTNSPLFSWSTDSNATYYGIWMNRDGAFYHKIWLEGATSYVHATDLPYGTYDWWVRTWCVDGYGDWSDGLNFTYGITTLLNPVGAIATNKPSFDWAAVDAADWYRIYVGRNGRLYHSHWTNAPNTSWIPGAPIPGGNYSWWIRTWNPETSVWSPRTDFTIP